MSPLRPVFRPRATTLLRVVVVGGAAILGSAAYAVLQYYHSPYWTRVGLAPDQPVLFSHRHHAGELRIDCRFCHASVETSAFAGMPTTQTCLNCHSQLFTDTAMLAPVIHSAETGQPLSWSRVTRLPDHVFFNHGVHIAGGVSCITCHGEVGRMALTAKAERLDMRQCLACHRNPASATVSQPQTFSALRPTASPEIATRPRDPHAFPAAGHLLNCSTCHH